jgi:hypothetical protein
MSVKLRNFIERLQQFDPELPFFFMTGPDEYAVWGSVYDDTDPIFYSKKDLKKVPTRVTIELDPADMETLIAAHARGKS